MPSPLERRARFQISMTAGMESTKAHKITLMDPGNGGERIRRTHLHLQRTVVLLAVLTVQPQVSKRLRSISGGMPLNPQTEMLSSLKYTATIKVHAPGAFPALCCPLSAPMAMRPPVVSARCSLLSKAAEAGRDHCY